MGYELLAAAVIEKALQDYKAGLMRKLELCIWASIYLHSVSRNAY